MGLFIIRPKLSTEDRISGAVAMVARSMKRDRRKQQIDEVVEQQRHDPVQRDIRSWLAERAPPVLEGSTPAAPPRITGTVLADLSDGDAEQMRKDLPHVAVIADRPMPLIEPNRTGAATAKTKLSNKDRWHLKAIGVIGNRGTRKTPLTGKHVTIAVLDTGIEATHPELGGRVTEAFQFDTGNWQPVPQNPSMDTNGHGTHVAGLIAGRSAGVAPDANLISGVMLPSGRGNLSDFLLALDFVGSRPDIQIVNISAGIAGYMPELQEAIASLLAVGVLPVAATGNEGRNRTRSPGNYAGVLSVGSCNPNDADDDYWVSSFSSSGSLVVDHHFFTVPSVVAPGKQVYSCVRGAANTYEAWDGTSMATPIVSGLAALVLQKYPNITVADLLEAIFSTVYVLEEEDEVRQGDGMVQIDATTWFD
jgi:subtilisin family serine protease